jgi:hypothetical protein
MRGRDLLIALGIGVAIVLLLSACGGGGEDTNGRRRAVEPLSEEVLLNKVVTGVGEDFRGGTHAGPPGFGLCIRLGLRRALDRQTLLRLLHIARHRHGAAYASQALNRLAVPVGDHCGGRRFVPELTTGGAVLHGARMVDSRAHRIGLEYGPYVGLSCRRPAGMACDRIGFDLVLRREARSVTATVDGHPIRLVTPGPVPHAAGAAGRDWGGYLDDVGFDPEERVPVRIAVVYPGGRRDRISAPSVLVSPGFG